MDQKEALKRSWAYSESVSSSSIAEVQNQSVLLYNVSNSSSTCTRDHGHIQKACHLHVLAPEIIKTDAANFRELMQRISEKHIDSKWRKKNPKISSKEEPRILSPNKSVELAMISGFHASGWV
ncbi:unnamed protein product [Fraxinus pennsylvanica]|uniref:VQ domain-containing protein n=1 Tax=Fraxinus pennsylvanica TaxID=56036 RepID=A0AAD1Z3M3_9LAMI|nr:unnamed protein product [Fraxinus pennsylvanica]